MQKLYNNTAFKTRKKQKNSTAFSKDSEIIFYSFVN